jgi:hypothetical protein
MFEMCSRIVSSFYWGQRYSVTKLESQFGKLRNQCMCRRILHCHEIPTSCPDCWLSLCYLLAAHGSIGLLRRTA